MKKKKLKLLLLIIFISMPLIAISQQLEVVPYKIANPTDDFTAEDGREYARLVAIAAAMKKDITIISPQSVDNYLARLSLNSQRIITEDDILKIGQMGNAEFVLIGTLSKEKGNYKSESILYSVWHKKIASKSHIASGNLFKLAEEEINDIFFDYSDKVEPASSSAKQIDAAIVLDLSYKVASEWDSIKAGIKLFADSISENWDIDTEINIITFSENKSEKLTGIKSASAVNEKLNGLKPAGTNSGRNFANALNYAVKNLQWRRKSGKILIVISNSDKIEGKFFDQYALAAKSKKITVNAVSLGLMRWDAAEPFRSFSAAGAGKHYIISYHQRYYDENGNPSDLFYQGGRIFYSTAYDDVWKKGLFEDKGKRFSILDKPRSFLNEIFYDEKKYDIIPYTLSKNYIVLMHKGVINKDQLENNIATVLENIGENFSDNLSKVKYKKPAAKALITDGKISMWIKIKDEKELDVLKSKEPGKNFFPIGIVVKKSPNDPYGINFQQKYIVDYGNDYIPEIIKTSLGSIIKNPDYYTSNGLFTPPVWFINVRAEKIENLGKAYDIREMGR